MIQPILTRRNWSIRACSAIKKEGLTEGFDWYFLELGNAG